MGKNKNFWLYDSDDFQPDPNGILAWLISELQDAENRGLKAWIIGHLSPGKADCLHEPSRYINQILRRYKHTVCKLQPPDQFTRLMFLFYFSYIDCCYVLWPYPPF